MSSPLIAILRPIFRRARTSTHSLTLHPLSRSLTILAPGPSSSSDSSTVIVEGPGSGRDSQPVSSAASLGSAPDGQQSGATIDAAPQDGQTNHSGASQHPYANLRSSTTDGSSVMEDGLTSLDTPAITPDLLPTPHRPTPQHPFDTHAFVLHMEKSEFSPGVSRTLMYATKQLVNDRADRGRRNLLHKEDVENVSVPRRIACRSLHLGADNTACRMQPQRLRICSKQLSPNCVPSYRYEHAMTVLLSDPLPPSSGEKWML